MIAVAGGGAAGFFAAIACAEAAPSAEVVLYEATAHPLAKVRVSGGGRCNVTHACPGPAEMAACYPRGSRELLGPLHRFGPADTVAWFAARGVRLKTEEDGRMFPVTDDSMTIVNCLREAALKAGVRMVTGCGVRECKRGALASSSPGREGPPRPHTSESGFAAGKIRGEDASFTLKLSDGSVVQASRLLIATGGGRDSAGLAIAASLGHTIEPPVPSLFTFHIDDPRLKGLEGLSVPQAEISVPSTRLKASGPVLVTHWGLSGPAILKLSAWGARELHGLDYRFALRVNWLGGKGAADVRPALVAETERHPKRRVATANPFGLPVRLWERLAAAAGAWEGLAWSNLSKAAADRLAWQVLAAEFAVSGKSMYKEEFVTCGGVSLREVDFATMESRLCPGLHFAGEVLDIDGLTGGYNFQAAWTTGWHAGRAMA